MTVQMLQKIFSTTTENKVELLKFADELKNNDTIELSQYASLKANINSLNRIVTPANITSAGPHRYSEQEIHLVLKSHLEVYDGLKNVQAHLNYMKKIFGELSSQYRNGRQYNKDFFKTLDTGYTRIGHSMPSNWIDITLLLLQSRKSQFNNILLSCKEIYKATGNQNMHLVLQKWSLRGNL